MKFSSLVLFSFLALYGVTFAAKPHAVIVVGTYHYSPNKTMPGFAAELERLGFDVTLINPEWDAEMDKRGLPGLEALATADVALFFTRFLKLGDEQLKHITDYVEAGKPVVGLRTSTHAFNYPKGHPQEAWNHGFGRDVLGTPYRIHLQGSTSVTLADGAADNPLLTGVPAGTWTSPGTLYLTALQPGTTPLLLGTGSPKGKKASTRTNGFGTHELKPVMTDTIAWTWTNKYGGRSFTTSLGHVGDFAVSQSMRIMVNGMFWAAGQPIPAADVTINTLGQSKAPAKTERKPSAKPAPVKPAPAPESAAPTNTDGVTILYGNSFIERLQEDGTFEALLQASSGDQRLQLRSLAYTGDEVGFRIRPAKFGDHLDYIAKQLPATRVLMGFGMNESFKGAAGLASFQTDLELYLHIIQDRHPDSELILLSPTAVQASTVGEFPEPIQRNKDIALYVEAMRSIADAQAVRFIDLFAPTAALFADVSTAYTDNSLHLNAAGHQAVAVLLAKALGDAAKVAAVDTDAPGFDALRGLVSRKAYEVAMAHKPANGIHYYGLRARPYEYEAEIPHHLDLAKTLDAAIWSQAKDLSSAQPMPALKTAKATPPGKTPRKGLGIIGTSAEDLAGFTVADGFSVNLFASSETFPDLINPLQIQFDARGRLWVCCFASYPVPLPGELSNDKILIFEDTNGDGVADKQTVFADGLKLPDGFVFYKDGIVASVARQLLWLRDTDGDSVADTHIELLRGADDTDTHHGGYLSRTPQGDIILNEALFHRGQFETPQGPLRTKNAAALYFSPRTHGLRIVRQTGHPNPWKITWNARGEALQMFGGGQIIDCDFYDVSTPVGTCSSSSMGMPFRDDKGCAIAFVSGGHFSDEWKNGVVTGHLLGKNAVLYTPLVYKDGVLVKAEASMNLLSTANKVFRPVDLQFGLDGALYVSDFYYPIIGHAQHSIRDSNRDYHNGRIWRVTRDGAPLASAPTIEGATPEALFDLLTHPHVTLRELVRFELEKHPDDTVLALAKSKVAVAQTDEMLGLEILWLLERLNDYSEAGLFRQLVTSKDLSIRRAAAKSLRAWAPHLGEEARAIASALAATSDERSRVSLISAASYLMTSEPFWADLIESVEAPADSPIDRMKRLAALADTPPIRSEFPLLKVSPDCNLKGWHTTKAGNGGSLWFKSDGEQAVILGYIGNPYMNINANGIPLLRATGTVHSKDGQLSLTLQPGLNKIEYYSEMDGKAKKGPVNLYLSDLTGNPAEGVSFATNNDEHQTWSEAYDAEFATVTDERILIKAVPSQLAFNVKSFTVPAGKAFTFVFENPDHMLHNLVITVPKKASAVGALADAMASDANAMARHFVPDSKLVLFSTPQIPHGGKISLDFTTPTQPGAYPYICTFPGHWRVMSGVMIVE